MGRTNTSILGRGPLRALRSAGAVAAVCFATSSSGKPLADSGNAPRGTGRQQSLGAGGLRAPRTSQRSRETVRQLDRAEREDTGRGLSFVWLNAASGYKHLWLEALSGNNWLGPTHSESAGAFNLEAAAGIRFIFLTAGVRTQRAVARDWTQWSVGGEIGLHIPLGTVEPSITLGAGYAWLAGLENAAGSATTAAPESIGGVNVELSPQLVWYPLPSISIGARANFGLLALSGETIPEIANSSPRDNSGVGLSAGASILAGFHL